MDDLKNFVSNRKVSIAGLLSDLDVLKRLPPGRTDELVVGPNPVLFEQAMFSHPKRGSSDFRALVEYVVNGKVPGKPKAHREPRAPRQRFDVECRWQDGERRIAFKKSFERELIQAGKDFAADYDGDEDIAGMCPDLAASILHLPGVYELTLGVWARCDSGQAFELAREIAADIVYEGAWHK